MTRSSSAALLVVAMVAVVPRPVSVASQEAAGLGGRWSLNRQSSQFPPEVGFGADWLPTGGAGAGRGEGGGRGRRGSGGGSSGVFAVPRESEDDAKRVQQLTAEVRTPSPRLTIVDTPGAVTITDERGRARTFHPDGKEEVLQLDGVPAAVISKREGGRLSILYKVEQGRELRYTFSRTPSPAQLIVDVQFLERGQGDSVRRIYEPTPAGTPDTTTAPAATPAPARTGEGLAGASASAADRQGMPASGGGLPGQTFNQKPDAELKGLKQLGVVVEDLSAQATACGLNQGTIESAVSKRLSDAGFRVIRDTDEDSYVYVNIITSSVSTGLCVSRYDLFFYTHTTATLSYQSTPVLVQVSLLHKGGIAGGAAAAHAEGVMRGVQEYLDQFVTRIREANK